MLRARLRGLLVLAYCALSMVGCFALSLPVVLATGKGATFPCGSPGGSGAPPASGSPAAGG